MSAFGSCSGLNNCILNLYKVAITYKWQVNFLVGNAFYFFIGFRLETLWNAKNYQTKLICVRPFVFACFWYQISSHLLSAYFLFSSRFVGKLTLLFGCSRMQAIISQCSYVSFCCLGIFNRHSKTYNTKILFMLRCTVLLGSLLRKLNFW